MRSDRPTVGAPIRSSPAKSASTTGTSRRPTIKATRQAISSAGLGGRSPATMPLMPAMRPKNAISRTADNPISAPPIRASKYGCMIVSFSAREQAFFLGLRRPGKDDVAIGSDQLLILARIFEALEQIENQLEPCVLLVVGAHDAPGPERVAGAAEHLVARLGVGLPLLQRFGIDGRILPRLQWVFLS